MKTINAIVSAYYCEDWLENRIKNLLDQARPVTPIIVCQKGSQEEAIAIGFPGCKIYTTPDIPTVYKAWNLALSFESDYVIIANSDDKLAKFATQKMAAILDETPEIGLVYANSTIVKEQYGEPVGYLDLRDPDYDLLEGCYIGHFPMYRRELHDKYGLYNEQYKIAGDYDFWLRLQKAGVNFCHITEYLGEFWDRGDNLEFAKNDLMIWEQARIRRAHGLK
jgi:hypothetical protein